jgi:hypothetical protein
MSSGLKLPDGDYSHPRLVGEFCLAPVEEPSRRPALLSRNHWTANLWTTCLIPSTLSKTIDNDVLSIIIIYIVFRQEMAVMAATPQAQDRRGFIGGSDARIIMGSDDAALVRLWREKRGEVEPEECPTT